MSAWYYHSHLKPQGPVSFEEMKRKILRGEVAPADLIHKEGQEQWLAACEWRDFSAELFPAFQKNYFKAESSPQEKEWILLVVENDVPRQEGPYSVEQMQAFLNSEKVQLEDYVWRSGLTGWVQIRDRREFFVNLIGADGTVTSPDL